MSSIQGPSQSPSPEPQRRNMNAPLRLKDYNDKAYGNAWEMQQAAQDIIEILNQFPPVNPKIVAAYKQIVADLNQVATGAPPSKEVCEKFIQAVKNFKNLALNAGVSGERFNNDISTINICLPQFEQWLDAGEPKA